MAWTTKTTPEIKAIPTEYNGIVYRSRLEARYAVFFDELEMRHNYEPEGFKFEDGTWYLPDFYLPDAKQYFEVKGVMTDEDAHKLDCMFMEREEVIVGASDMRFAIWSFHCWDGITYSPPGYPDFSDVSLCKCPDCGRYYFLDERGSWACKVCGAYDGDKYHYPIITGNLDFIFGEYGPEVEAAIFAARNADFKDGKNVGRKRNTPNAGRWRKGTTRRDKNE